MKFRAVSLLRDSRPALLRVVAGSAAFAAAAGFAPAQSAEKVLYRFTGGSDGAYPTAGLIFDSKGALYGTTASGGGHVTGTVFKLKPPVPPATQWTERLLYIFKVGSDGFNPEASLIFDGKGALYGTTQQGGTSNFGTVFKLKPPSLRQRNGPRKCCIALRAGATALTRLPA